jgi:hypothetical protein
MVHISLFQSFAASISDCIGEEFGLGELAGSLKDLFALAKSQIGNDYEYSSYQGADFVLLSLALTV